MKNRILLTLSAAQGYVSGQELCRQFKVSRTAVWKVINQLKEEGYVIESVPSKGYRILARPDLITDGEVACCLNTEWAGRQIVYYPTIDSTNTEAARLARNGAPEGTLVIAEEQMAGKGRRGRSWVTPAGSAIAMSLVIRPLIDPSHASMITLVMGMSVTLACRECCQIEAAVKWPNDVVAGGRKVCGILTEMDSEMDYIHSLVIGIGINTHIEHFPSELEKTADSLHRIMGRIPNRAELIAACMEKFEKYYGRFLKTQDFSELKDEYNELLVGIGGRVRVLAPGNEYEGISEGINEAGELLVLREDGTKERVYAGEVSVRGIYGYT